MLDFTGISWIIAGFTLCWVYKEWKAKKLEAKVEALSPVLGISDFHSQVDANVLIQSHTNIVNRLLDVLEEKHTKPK